MSAVTAIPLPLHRLSAREAEQRSRIAAWRAPLRIPDYDAFMLVPIEQSEADVNLEADRLAINIEFGDDRLKATTPPGIVVDLLGALDQRLERDPLPPPDLAALLLESVLTPMLERVERATGRPIRFKSVVPASSTAVGAPLPSFGDPKPHAADAPPSVTVYLSLRGPRFRQTLTLSGPTVAIDPLLGPWRAGHRPLAALPLPLSLQIGATRLPIRVLASLRTGDAILLQDIFGAWPWNGPLPSALRMVAGGRLITTVRHDEGEWRLDGALQTDGQAGQTVTDNPDNSATGATLTAGDLDSLPVQLIFEAARLELPLGEVRRLGAGSILQIDAVLAAVRIIANGQPIGVGELVAIDGRAGVRITAFSASADSLPRRGPDQ